MVPKYLDYLPREAPMLSEWHTGVSAQLRARGGPYGGRKGQPSYSAGGLYSAAQVSPTRRMSPLC